MSRLFWKSTSAGRPAKADQFVQNHTGCGRDVQGTLVAEHGDSKHRVDVRREALRNSVDLMAEDEADGPCGCPFEEVDRVRRRLDRDRLISVCPESAQRLSRICRVLPRNAVLGS